MLAKREDGTSVFAIDIRSDDYLKFITEELKPFVWAYGVLRDTSGILLDRTPATSDLPEVMKRAEEAERSSVVPSSSVKPVGKDISQ